MIPCMGGWCNQRDKCANYYADGIPVERLCGEKEEVDLLTQKEKRDTEPMNMFGGFKE